MSASGEGGTTPRTRSPPVRGRFAPSPTGPLHFGSLVAAVASFLDARSRGGEWLVRIEDLDRPREMPGAADGILRTLEACALHWDGTVVYQSRREALYGAALDRLQRAGLLYACGCTRREVADSALSGIEGPVYPGTCRAGLAPGRTARAWRVRASAEAIEFTDELQGPQRQSIEQEVGDFVLKRADGCYAYQLAVVVDDAEQRMTRIVRGADLLHSTARQIHLQRALGLDTPAYMHVPVAINAAGEKLSKQTFARPVDAAAIGATLVAVLDFLGQRPPALLRNAGAEEIMRWAIAHWSQAAMPSKQVRFAEMR